MTKIKIKIKAMKTLLLVILKIIEAILYLGLCYMWSLLFRLIPGFDLWLDKHPVLVNIILIIFLIFLILSLIIFIKGGCFGKWITANKKLIYKLFKK